MSFDALFGLELQILQSIAAHRTWFWDNLFLFFHYVGKEPGYFFFAVLALYFRRNKRAVLLVIGTLFCWGINVAIKETVGQVRPFDFGELTHLVQVSQYSFPSGHAQLSAFFWSGMCFVWPHRAMKWIAAVLILGIGASRLYLGVHFPHDVIAGWVVGFSLVFVVFRKQAGR